MKLTAKEWGYCCECRRPFSYELGTAREMRDRFCPPCWERVLDEMRQWLRSFDKPLDGPVSV